MSRELDFSLEIWNCVIVHHLPPASADVRDHDVVGSALNNPPSRYACSSLTIPSIRIPRFCPLFPPGIQTIESRIHGVLVG